MSLWADEKGEFLQVQFLPFLYYSEGEAAPGEFLPLTKQR